MDNENKKVNKEPVHKSIVKFEIDFETAVTLGVGFGLGVFIGGIAALIILDVLNII